MLRKLKKVQRGFVCCGDLKGSERVSVLRRFKGVQRGFVGCGDLKMSREDLCVAEI